MSAIRLALGATLVSASSLASAQAINLMNYAVQGSYSLPITAPGLSIQYEASGVTWNRSTNTLFVLGDGGRFVQQLSLTGVPIDYMSLPTTTAPSRAGVEFDDPEGIAWINGSTFVMTEERKRNAVQFTYTPGTTLARSDTSTVTLGTTVGNTGLEGVTYDPSSGTHLFVNQAAGSGGSTQNIFQTGITFAGLSGTATNGSATTVNATSLFPPANIGLADLNDVYALSNVSSFAGSASNNLLVLYNGVLPGNQPSVPGILKEISRSGTVLSQLSLPIGVQFEGVTMDDRGYIYLVSDNGDFGTTASASQLLVLSPIPEPHEYAMMLAGLGLVSAVAKRRRSKDAVKTAASS